MISTDLYREILVKPTEAGATELLIVSGYATASMAHRHLTEPSIKTKSIAVQMIYGMASAEGVSQADDAMFARLEENEPFTCYYRIERPAVHSKVYVWMSNDTPIMAFVGSANYTQRGFLGGHQQGEAMAETDADDALAYFREVLAGAMEIGHDDIEEHVTLFSPTNQHDASNECANLPLIITRGRDSGIVHPRSGLNWGQRPEERRNPNQAYIPIPASIAQTGLFPDRAVRFTILTDDGFSFIGAVAQDNNKSITSPEGNNIIGEYFRRRLGVGIGTPVDRSHLDAYGRTDVRFCKLDEETFLMDFSV